MAVIDVNVRVFWKGPAGGGMLAMLARQLPARLNLVRLLTEAQLPLVGRVLVEQ